MPVLTIKGMPDALYRRLKKRAAAHRRSLNSEIIAMLDAESARPAPDPAELLARVDAFRNSLNLRPMSDEEVRAAIEEGRE